MTIIKCLERTVFGLFFMIPLTFFAQKTAPKKVRLPKTLTEVSGMAGLRNDPTSVFYLLNDSGNSPELFVFPTTQPGQGGAGGTVFNPKKITSVRLPVRNRDWEDLAADPSGRLFVGDFGNNSNARRDLKIYVYDPRSGKTDSILFHYPDQKSFPPANKQDWNFNCEAMVFWADSLHIFSKNSFSGNFFTKHYVLPARPGKYAATLRDSFLIPGQVVTGAAISPDGQHLALVSYFFGRKFGFLPHSKASVRVFSGFSGSNFFKGKMRKKRLRKFLVHRQYESIAYFDTKNWLISAEGAAIFGPVLRRLKW